MNKALLDKLFEGFSILRWNDMPRSMPLVELDKHAHKMMLAWLLGHLAAERQRSTPDWGCVVEGGIFELLRRLVCSDIQAPVYREIERELGDDIGELHAWIVDQVQPLLGHDAELLHRFRLFVEDRARFFANHALERELLQAAHRWASLWELENLIAPVHPRNDEVDRIREELKREIEASLGFLSLSLADFQRDGEYARLSPVIDRLGFLRMQIRWAHTPRLPTTSVLGHSMFVAVVGWLLARASNEALSVPQPTARRRLVNAFFRGLLHDIAESLTRDIIRPVKRAIERGTSVIRRIERRWMQRAIFDPLHDCAPSLEAALRFLVEDEFVEKTRSDGPIPPLGEDALLLRLKNYAQLLQTEDLDPVDGWLLKAADDFAAFLEAHKAIEFGVQAKPLVEAAVLARERYREERPRRAAETLGISLLRLYADYA